jgi:hypothetical protein
VGDPSSVRTRAARARRTLAWIGFWLGFALVGLVLNEFHRDLGTWAMIAFVFLSAWMRQR